MNYLKILKENINDVERRHGLRGKVLVDSAALSRLIEHYEQLDSLERASADHAFQALEHRLHNILLAMLHSGRYDGNGIVFLISDILQPLVAEKKKARETEALFRR